MKIFLWAFQVHMICHNWMIVNPVCSGNVLLFTIIWLLIVIVGADFVDQHRETLIQRVPSVMEVADCLESKNIITKEMYQNIQAKPTPQDKMREVYVCLDSAGRAAKQEFL